MEYSGNSIENIFSKDSNVESVLYKDAFEKACPIYMSYGLTYDDFWYGDPYKAKYQREAYKLKIRHEDEMMWEQGMYIYEAIYDCSPILRPFSKAQKPLPYLSEPYLVTEDKKEKDKEKEIEQERLKAQVWINNWALQAQRHFKNKE